VIYTAAARKALVGLTQDDMDAKGLRGAMEPYAALIAERLKTAHGAVWGLAETGASGPTGNRYGDPAGHTAMAVSGPVSETRVLQTGSDDRVGNMWAFADAALSFLVEALERA
jgi:nicotinamide-nucleotide amidase